MDIGCLGKLILNSKLYLRKLLKYKASQAIQAKFILFIAFILIAGGIRSQDTLLQFNSLTVNDGLSQSWVHCIHQDKLGYMWFGTEDGLNRYDGHNIISFKYNSREKGTLSNNTIFAIADGIDNNLWIGTFKGLNLLNRSNNCFIIKPEWPKDQVLSLAIDRKKDLWIVTPDTIYVLDQSTNVIIKKIFVTYQAKSRLPAEKTHFLSICIDSHQNTWIGTNNGLSYYDSKGESFTEYFHDPDNPESIGGGNVLTIFEDHKERLWIGHLNGLDLFEDAKELPKKGKFRHFTNHNNDPFSISAGWVLTIIEDKNYKLWVGVQNGGISILDLNTEKINGKFIHCNTSYSLSYNLRNKSIYSSFKDRQLNLWLGTFGNGVNMNSPIANSFKLIRHNPNEKNSLSNNQVNAFLDDGQYIWIGTEGGLNRYDKSKGTYSYYTNNPDISSSIGSDAVWAIHKDKNGTIWLGTWAGGLNKLDVKSGRFTRYINNPDDTTSIGSNNIFAIYEDNEGNLWLGTMGSGLNMFDRKNNRFIRYKTRNSGIAGNYVEAIDADNSGNLWLACMDFISCFNIKSKKFINYQHNSSDSLSISGNKMYSIFNDSRNNLWIGTDVGLNLFDPVTNTFTSYQINDGLPDNAIKSITEDYYGNLWLGTNKGLSKFINAVNKPKIIQFKNYSADDGLQSNEFNRRSCMRSHEGNLYFGGENGFNTFFPENIFENKYVPEIVFTDFQLFNNPVPIGEKNSPLKQDICITKSITLNHKQSVFTIKYVAFNYVVPEKNQYAYMMEGFEKDWNYVGSKREATYTNLSPGTYIFKVIASNNDGIWNRKGLTLEIIILPPWWKTIWFKVLLFSLVLSLIGFYLYYRTKRLQIQKKILEKEVKMRTSQLSEITVVLEEKQEEIMAQNEELELHKAKLEQMVQERTADLEKALKKAEESDRLKTAFLANMSHEIRTPMNSIVGFSGLLGSRDYTDAEKDEFISIIYGNCETLQVLIDDIIEVSLIESDQVVIHKTLFDIIPLMKELESYYRMKNEKNLDITFVNKNEENSVWIYSDPVRFRQIITNLVDNSVKYTESGYIYFGFNLFNRLIEVKIEDSGIGIPTDELKNVFNHFYKVETANTKLYRGAGIGLSICQKLVRMLDGTIRIESEVGKGTSVIFTLPYEQKQEINRDLNIKPREIKGNIGELSILIVEDEEFNFYLLKKIIEKSGPSIKWAKNGKEAVEMIQNNFKPDMILMDIKMPVMNGVEATKIIRPIIPDVPIIAVTAYTSAADKEKYENAGFDTYITKPIDPNGFIKMLEKCIK